MNQNPPCKGFHIKHIDIQSQDNSTLSTSNYFYTQKEGEIIHNALATPYESLCSDISPTSQSSFLPLRQNSGFDQPMRETAHDLSQQNRRNTPVVSLGISFSNRKECNRPGPDSPARITEHKLVESTTSADNLGHFEAELEAKCLVAKEAGSDLSHMPHGFDDISYFPPISSSLTFPVPGKFQNRLYSNDVSVFQLSCPADSGRILPVNIAQYSTSLVDQRFHQNSNLKCRNMANINLDPGLFTYNSPLWLLNSEYIKFSGQKENHARPLTGCLANLVDNPTVNDMSMPLTMHYLRKKP